MSAARIGNVTLELFREKLAAVDLMHWHMQDFADHFKVSQGTLHNRLRESGTTFLREVTHERKRRVEAAAGRIEDRDKLARYCGFTDYAAFARGFRKWYGESFYVWHKSRNKGERACAQ